MIHLPFQPVFSPSDVAILLKRPKSMVTYWMREGKLTTRKDFRGRPYILRDDLREFIRTYLLLHCT